MCLSTGHLMISFPALMQISWAASMGFVAVDGDDPVFLCDLFVAVKVALSL